jgi:Ca2+-binding RTX toxin-like protein
MARLNLGALGRSTSLLTNDRFDGIFDALARMVGGTEHTHLTGTSGNNVLIASSAGSSIAGIAGNNVLIGGAGSDTIWGGAGNDTIRGGSGNDTLVAGTGNGTINGGRGNDTLLVRSNSGEPIAAQDGATQIFAAESAVLAANNTNTLIGGRGADTFRFEGLINAKEEIIAKHTDEDGNIDWAGVTGENDNVHDHWVDGFGNATIRDFNRAEGDKIEIAAHTAAVKSIEYRDVNGDGRIDSVITVISDQGGAGAHDQDAMGTITVLSNRITNADITVDAGVTYGAYDNINDVPAGVHFLTEYSGVLPGGQSDGGHHHA